MIQALDYSTLCSEDLYQLCLRGDEKAWHHVYNFVLRITRSGQWRLRTDPEDMAQTIVMHLLSGAIDKVADPKAFKSFIRTTARHKILDSFKRKQHPTVSYDNDEAPVEHIFFDPASEYESPEQVVIGNCTAAAINQAMTEISDKCREVLDAYLDYRLGLIKNYQELAQKFGESVGTVSSRINRCLKQLKHLSLAGGQGAL